MSHKITVEGGKTVRLPTKGKYCDRDIVITAEGVNVEEYEGYYVLTPKVDAQTIPTKDKYMIDDVYVEAIPIFDVSNNSGGTTFYIATNEPDGGKSTLGKMKLGATAL